MGRYKARHFLAVSVLLGLPALTCGVGPVVLDLIERVEVIEEILFSEPVETILFDDDFEDGIDPAWVQTVGTTQTIQPTSCVGAHFYPSCGSLGLHFDESEQYDLLLPERSGGSFSLYFYDDPSDTDADAIVGAVSPGAAEYIGVQTDACPNHYTLQLSGNIGKTCTRFQRRKGWHRMEFVRDGRSSRGYIDYVLVFETNLPDTNQFELFRVIQNAPSPAKMLDGFAIDDVRFVATGE